VIVPVGAAPFLTFPNALVLTNVDWPTSAELPTDGTPVCVEVGVTTNEYVVGCAGAKKLLSRIRRRDDVRPAWELHRLIFCKAGTIERKRPAIGRSLRHPANRIRKRHATRRTIGRHAQCTLRISHIRAN
jgi:hypothetical protein